MLVVEFTDGTTVVFKNNEEWKNSHFKDKPHRDALVAYQYDPDAYFTRYRVIIRYSQGIPTMETDEQVIAASNQPYLESKGSLNQGKFHLGDAYGYSSESWHAALKHAVRAADEYLT